MRVDPWLLLQSVQPLRSIDRLERMVDPVSGRLRREMDGTMEGHKRWYEEVLGAVEGRTGTGTGTRNEALMSG